jgi:hypothetical protein
MPKDGKCRRHVPHSAVKRLDVRATRTKSTLNSLEQLPLFAAHPSSSVGRLHQGDLGQGSQKMYWVIAYCTFVVSGIAYSVIHDHIMKDKASRKRPVYTFYIKRVHR